MYNNSPVVWWKALCSGNTLYTNQAKVYSLECRRVRWPVVYSIKPQPWLEFPRHLLSQRQFNIWILCNKTFMYCNSVLSVQLVKVADSYHQVKGSKWGRLDISDSACGLQFWSDKHLNATSSSLNVRLTTWWIFQYSSALYTTVLACLLVLRTRSHVNLHSSRLPHASHMSWTPAGSPSVPSWKTNKML